MRRENLSTGILNDLLGRIQNGDFKQNDRLPPLEALSSEYAVSRATIREAIKQLEILGFVQVRHGRGCYVHQISGDTLAHQMRTSANFDSTLVAYVVEVRLAVEVQSARLAAQRRDQDDLLVLDELQSRMEKCLDRPADFAALDRDFHLAISRATKNPMFPAVLDAIRSFFVELQRILIFQPKVVETAHKFHARILGAIRAGDADRAAARMTSHLENVYRLLGGS